MTVDSGGAPTLRVTSPNGGEAWQAGPVHPITWTASGAIANVKIEYSTTSPWDGQLVDPTVIVASAPNTGAYSWTVPFAMSKVCHVRVSDVAGSTSDVSDAAFEIMNCGFIGLSPPFSQSFGAAGGRGMIQVMPSMGCSWSVDSDDSWIVVTSGWSGTGSGSLTHSVAPNLDSAPRSGTLRIGGASFSVEQSGGTPSTEGVVFVPIVPDVFGVAPSHYTSELTLTNRSDRDASVRLTYTGASTLGGVGALFVTSSDGDLSGIIVGARTSAPGGGGRYGLFYPATPSGGASSGTAWLYGLQQNGSNRTNLAIVNTGETGGDDDVFAIDVYDGAFLPASD